MEEELEQRHAQQREAGVARGTQSLPDAHHHQTEREQRPGDRVGHVAGKIAGELEDEGCLASGREVVGDFQVQEEEGEDDAERVQQNRGIELGNAVARRSEQARRDEKCGGRQSVGIEIPVEDRSRAAGLVAEHL